MLGNNTKTRILETLWPNNRLELKVKTWFALQQNAVPCSWLLKQNNTIEQIIAPKRRGDGYRLRSVLAFRGK